MREFPPFRLDSLNQCLWRTGEAGREERILLTPKAFAVLMYLVDHAGQLVTHEELLEAVWAGSVVELQAVKRNILEVRSALGDRPKNSVFIETVTKRGYRFIAPVSERIVPSAAAPERAVRGTLVGRDQALDELHDRLQRATQGERQIIFITGEAGLGKTALVDEFRRQVASTALSIRIAQGQCVEGYGGKEPYYPMLDALGRLCAGRQGEAVVRVLAARAPTWLVQFPALLKREHREMLRREILGATRDRMLREIGEAMEVIAVESPLLLILEDLQWVDHSTVDLISALGRRQAPTKLMLLATCRPLDLESPGHPLKALIQDLLVHRLCREIAPPPLSEAQIEQYLTARSSNPPEGLSALLHRHSEGNPLFMVAALDHMTKRALICQENGSWQLRAPLAQLEREVPDDLRRMIEAQLERLRAEEQSALELASLVGVAFCAPIITSASDLDPPSFEDIYEDLSRRQQIVRWAGTQRFPDGTVTERYEFVHALYRQVLYDRQPPGRRARLHRRIGERLEALYSQRMDDIVLVLAHHFEEAADWPRAIRYLRLAADTAARRYAPLEAAPMLRRALELASHLTDPERSASEIETLEKLATNYVVSADIRSIETYETLIEKAAHHGLVDTEIRALLALAWPLCWTSIQRGLDVLSRALRLSTAQHDPLLQAKTRAQGLAFRIWAGGWDAREADECTSALAVIRKAGDPALLAPYLVECSVIPLFSSHYRASYRGLVEARTTLNKATEAIAYTNRSYALVEFFLPLCLLYLGEWGEALREIDATLTRLHRNGYHYRAQLIGLLRASLHLHAMDFAGARDLCESALPLVTDPVPRPAPNAPPPYPSEFHSALIISGSAETALGNQQRAMEYLSAARQDMERSMSVFDWYSKMPLEAGCTEVALAAGKMPQTRAAAQQYLEMTLTTAERTWQALAWEANARVAQAEPDLIRAKNCVDKALQTMEGFELPLAAWRVHATAAEIDAASGNLQSARSHREVSRATILQLANSLPAKEPLRLIFLAAPAVARVLNSDS